jgi:hypothetical protein
VKVTGDLQIGDQCDIFGGKYTGEDDCDAGLICLLTDDNGEGGVCVEFCGPNDTCPDTNNASCNVYNDGALPICLANCDPLIQDCPNGQGCYNSAGNNFVCFVTTADPGEGGVGDECAYLNQCQPGNICLTQAAVQGCAFESCCNPYCAVSDGGVGVCQDQEDCQPFFMMNPPPGYDDVGVCAIP